MSQWKAEPGVIRLPDGRRVRGTGTRRPRGDAPHPDFAVYLLGKPPRTTARASRWVKWRDFRLPSDRDDAIDALREAYERSASERVEIACGGGIGRTGTAIAILARMSGIPADEAVAWTRANYHPRAVETRRQRTWVRDTEITPCPESPPHA